MKMLISLLLFLISLIKSDQDTQICGGFIQFDKAIPAEVKKNFDLEHITISSYTTDMILKEQSNPSQNGYYFLPVYEEESIILKIGSPYGMIFEPEQYIFNVDEEHSISSYCASDVNFKFKGFVVEGQISTFGSNDGPQGVELVIIDQENKEIESVKTGERGFFGFSPLYPGKYTIKPRDSSIFDPNHNKFDFDVKFTSKNSFPRALIVKGFKVQGEVKADNEPIKDVSVLIYSRNSTLIKNYQCEQKIDENIKQFELNQLTPFCLVKTDEKGQYIFKNIPVGEFYLRALVINEYLNYELEPKFQQIQVGHYDLKVSESFNVGTFSIFGKVVNSKKIGIADVKVKIDGQNKAVTNKNGVYVLKGLQSGNYDLEAQAEDVYFDPLTNININAHLSALPDLTVSLYKLCGKIIIGSSDYISSNRRSVVLVEVNDPSRKERITITDANGKYCFEVTPGLYDVYPIISSAEREADFHLTPEKLEIHIEDKPILDVNFYQSKVSVSGEINCLEKCDSEIKLILISTKSDKTFTTETVNKKFKFENILSGHYKLIVKKPEFCWEEDEKDIKIQNKDISGLTFKQKGFSLFYSSRHNIAIEYLHSKSNLKQKATLLKDEFKICLPKSGEYKIFPKSCHKFNEEFFVYQTDSSDPLILEPTGFLTKGSIKLANDVKSKILNKNMTITTDILVEEIIGSDTVLNKKITVDHRKSSNFLFYTKPYTSIIVTPLISKNLSSKAPYSNLLFYPKYQIVKIEEECLSENEKINFEMRYGLIIEGQVKPAMKDVNISAFNSETNELIVSVNTSENGKYKIGPLYNEVQYTISANKEGFKIIESPEKKYDFIAEKLSFLRVKIVDVAKNPISSVFLSLSSSDRTFKVNNNTNAQGYIDFYDLYPGDYYIKPLFKEYKFEPSQKLVKISGGEHYEETLVGHRIAFSIYGKEKVEGLYVQAYCNETKQIQETPVDRSGEYRLRGLNPGYTYIIKVKIPQNLQIEKALPASIPYKLSNADATGVDFIVLQRPIKTDIKGYLSYFQEQDNCPLDKVSNAYVELYNINEDEDLTLLKTQRVLNACQFTFRSLEKGKYIVKLYEKQGKNQNSKLLKETTIDLNNENQIVNGVHTISFKIETIRSMSSEQLNYSIYKTLFLFLVVISVLKFDLTKKIIGFLLIPFKGRENTSANVFMKKKKNK